MRGQKFDRSDAGPMGRLSWHSQPHRTIFQVWNGNEAIPKSWIFTDFTSLVGAL